MSSVYASIAAKARLDLIKLVHSAFDVTPELPGNESLNLEIATRWLEHSHKSEAALVTGVCEWMFRCVRDQDGPPLVKVVARYMVQYSRVGEETEAALAFLRDVGRMAVYPYFRVIVAVLASEAGLVMPPLPSINIGTFQKKTVLTGTVATRHRNAEATEGDLT